MASTADLVTACRDLIGEDTAAKVTDAQFVRWLNMAQRNLCAEGNILISAWTASTVASQETYTVPSDFLRVLSVFIYNTTTGTKRKLRAIDLQSRDASKQTGTPAFYYVGGINVSGVNSYMLGLNPIPATTGSSDLELYGRQQPLTMVSGGQAPEIMTPWQDYLIAYAANRCYTRRGPAWGQMADRMWAEWERGIEKAKEFKNPLMEDWPTQIADAAGYGRAY